MSEDLEVGLAFDELKPEIVVLLKRTPKWRQQMHSSTRERSDADGVFDRLPLDHLSVGTVDLPDYGTAMLQQRRSGRSQFDLQPAAELAHQKPAINNPFERGDLL